MMDVRKSLKPMVLLAKRVMIFAEVRKAYGTAKTAQLYKTDFSHDFTHPLRLICCVEYK